MLLPRHVDSAETLWNFPKLLTWTALHGKGIKNCYNTGDIIYYQPQQCTIKGKSLKICPIDLSINFGSFLQKCWARMIQQQCHWLSFRKLLSAWKVTAKPSCIAQRSNTCAPVRPRRLAMVFTWRCFWKTDLNWEDGAGTNDVSFLFGFFWREKVQLAICNSLRICPRVVIATSIHYQVISMQRSWSFIQL